MNSLPRVPTLLFAAALLLPGLVAALPVCTMAGCGSAMGARCAGKGHEGCPPGAVKVVRAVKIGVACCQRVSAPPVNPSKLPERSDAAGSAPARVPDTTALRPALSAVPQTASTDLLPPLDSLAQSCILRI
ncbi:MAG: hypothetical protein ABJC13_19920 [Acidobacteriota bacterium]